MYKVIIITGQTATGKTRKALQIASEVNGELINCDSRQIYRKLDIITGKDFTEQNFRLERKINGFNVGYYTINVKSSVGICHPELVSGSIIRSRNKFGMTKQQIYCNKQIKNQQPISNLQSLSIPLWLYDVVDPKEHFSSYDYKVLAMDVIADILSRGKTPIIVGGAGYYLYYLLYDIPTSGIPQNWDLRNSLADKSTEELQNKYKALDPKAFIQLNDSERNNTQRLIRKIEIVLYEKDHNKISSKIGLSSSLSRCFNLSKKALKIHVVMENDKEKLKQTINVRVNERLDKGELDEVRQLIAEGYCKNDPGLKTIGYQQLISYIEGQILLEQAKQEWITKEIQYAKRQETFLKKYLVDFN